MFPFYSTPNQDLVLRLENGVNQFRMVMNSKCLTWIPDQDYVLGNECTRRGENQRFEFVCADCHGRHLEDEKLDDKVSKAHEGFYTEKMMGLLGQIKTMVSEFKSCLVNNGTCVVPETDKPLLCFSPFDSPPDLSKPWSSLNSPEDESGDNVGGNSGRGDDVSGDDTNDIPGNKRDEKDYPGYDDHDEGIPHNDEDELEMEHKFNKGAAELEECLERFSDDPFDKHNETGPESEATSTTIEDIQKLHMLPPYTNLVEHKDDDGNLIHNGDGTDLKSVHPEVKNDDNKILKDIIGDKDDTETGRSGDDDNLNDAPGKNDDLHHEDAKHDKKNPDDLLPDGRNAIDHGDEIEKMYHLIEKHHEYLHRHKHPDGDSESSVTRIIEPEKTEHIQEKTSSAEIIEPEKIDIIDAEKQPVTTSEKHKEAKDPTSMNREPLQQLADTEKEEKKEHEKEKKKPLVATGYVEMMRKRFEEMASRQ